MYPLSRAPENEAPTGVTQALTRPRTRSHGATLLLLSNGAPRSRPPISTLMDMLAYTQPGPDAFKVQLESQTPLFALHVPALAPLDRLDSRSRPRRTALERKMGGEHAYYERIIRQHRNEAMAPRGLRKEKCVHGRNTPYGKSSHCLPRRTSQRLQMAP